MTGGTAGRRPDRRSSPRASTRRSSCCATASRSGSARAGSRARPRRRCPTRAGARRRSPARGSPRPHASPMLPVPRGRPLEIVHSPLARTTETAALVAAAIAARRRRRRRRRARPVRPEPGILEIGQGEWEGETHDEIARRWTAELAGVAAPARRGVGAGRRVARRRSRRAPGRRSPAILERLGRDYPRGQPRPAPGRRLPRRRARQPTSRGRSSSATTACSRSCC